jgi:hypothetical protein
MEETMSDIEVACRVEGCHAGGMSHQLAAAFMALLRDRLIAGRPEVAKAELLALVPAALGRQRPQWLGAGLNTLRVHLGDWAFLIVGDGHQYADWTRATARLYIGPNWFVPGTDWGEGRPEQYVTLNPELATAT